MIKKKFSEYINAFDFKGLFVDLGWDNYSGKIPITVDEICFEIKGIVEKRGFVIAFCPSSDNGEIPLSSTRKKIEQIFRKFHQEHLIIYADKAKTKQIWQFVVQEPDKPKKTREIQFSMGQDSEILFQRARGLLFTLDEEENITLVDVVARFKDNFAKNTEKITKQFFTEFKKRHTAFLGFVSGIDDAIADKVNSKKQWYASVMLNRLMFCYFIQKRGYLDNNPHYLQDKLKQVKSKAGKDQFYSFYRDFLLELFHKGLGQPENKRMLSVELGRIPYLNGGLFDVHELEKSFNSIRIKDDAFEKIFTFFDQWNWHLDTRIEASGKDINPDVIGYIFEKYINDRAAMGAYYTKEDITDYIGKNTIIPFLFDKVKKAYPKGFKKDSFIWSFLKDSKDTYIYDAIKKGIPEKGGLFDDLPDEIKAGFLPELEQETVKELTSPHLWEIRKCWNKKAPKDIALPTEIYREVIERRNRYAKLKSKIKHGDVTEINDFITYNLNIRQFVQDVLENIDDPDFIRHFYQALKSITILDPTCGSGAFLFAALNILEPLYETCIERMEQFTSETPGKFKFFHETLAEVNSKEHPNLGYFIYKTIILNNLYGVDIMHEAVEIAKLRLFLKMVGAVDINVRKPNYGLEPLPDVDFNIRAGNTLVGFASEDDFKKVLHDREGLFGKEKFQEFEDEFSITAKAFKRFQDSQLIVGKSEETHKQAKQELKKRLYNLNDKLNEYLASTYDIDRQKKQKNYDKWLESHQPFHWLSEFYEIINSDGGFDVVIGNPPYVEYSKIKKRYQMQGYQTLKCGNLYCYVFERSAILSNSTSKLGLIIPLSICSGLRMGKMREWLKDTISPAYIPNFEIFPSKLFDGAFVRISIVIGGLKGNDNDSERFMSKLYRWYSVERDHLVDSLAYQRLFYDEEIDLLRKMSDRVNENIFISINNLCKGNKIASSIVRSSKYFIYYQEATNYWMKAVCRIPYYKKNGSVETPDHGRIINFQNETESRSAMLLMNSSLFYLWYSTFSDGFHLSDFLVKNFPFNKSLSNLLDKDFYKSINDSIKNNSIIGNRNTKKGDIIEIEEFKISKSKVIIDQIDTTIAQHYNFTEEELDFIINYDIKYRMGKELETYIEGTLGK